MYTHTDMLLDEVNVNDFEMRASTSCKSLKFSLRGVRNALKTPTLGSLGISLHVFYYSTSEHETAPLEAPYTFPPSLRIFPPCVYARKRTAPGKCVRAAKPREGEEGELNHR